jgi:hypothetical protein
MLFEPVDQPRLAYGEFCVQKLVPCHPSANPVHKLVNLREDNAEVDGLG